MKSPLTIYLPSGTSFEMIFVDGGSFEMGSKEYDWAQPVQKVTVPSFYIGKYPVTRFVYDSAKDLEKEKGTLVDNRPVNNVSWKDAKRFIQQLNKQTGRSFRLPSEAEWEYAARGGKYSQGYNYSGSDKLKQVGWYNENSGNETKEVGLLLPNELGIYDMSGNVWEWCEDDYHGDYKGVPLNGQPWIDKPERGGRRVIRGGSYFFNAELCRPTYRSGLTPDARNDDMGFRLVLSLLSGG